MDRWKSRGGESQRQEEKKWGSSEKRKEWEERRCRCAKKVRKLRSLRFYPWFVAPGGSKRVGVAKAAGAEPVWSDKRWKIARRCGAKHIWKYQKAKSTSAFRPLLEVADVKKKRAPLWRSEHAVRVLWQVSKVYNYNWRSRTTIGRCDVDIKCTPLWLRTTATTTTTTTVQLRYTTLVTVHYTTIHSTTSALHFTTLKLHYMVN